MARAESSSADFFMIPRLLRPRPRSSPAVVSDHASTNRERGPGDASGRFVSMSFHAYAAHEKKGPLVPFVYEPSPLGPHDVEVRVTHCGFCHSDVHLVDGDWGVGTYPMVPGHEIVGTVAAAGPEVRHLQVGQRVGVGWQRTSCLACELCNAGHENLCPRSEDTCVDHYGG